jgi:predicted transcriptional regulator
VDIIILEGMMVLNQEKDCLNKIIDKLKSDDKFLDELSTLIIKKVLNKYLEDPSKSKTDFVNINKEIEEIYTTQMNFDNYKIVCKVKDMLSDLRISQKTISEKTQIPPSSLSGILNNTMPISLNYAFRICRVLGLTMEEGFDFVDLNNTNK